MGDSCDLELAVIDDAARVPACHHFDGNIERLQFPDQVPHAVDMDERSIPEPEDGSPFVSPQNRDGE